MIQEKPAIIIKEINLPTELEKEELLLDKIKDLNLCKSCGTCCRCFFLPYDHIEFKDLQQQLINKTIDSNQIELIFCLENCIPLSWEEIIKANPYILNYKEVEEISKSNNAYACKKFDSENNLCKVHDRKIRMCKNYPFYNNVLTNYINYSCNCFFTDKCGYKEYIDQLLKELNNGS